MFELIFNACLYNIVFVNNLSPHLKNSGSATGYRDAEATSKIMVASRLGQLYFSCLLPAKRWQSI